MQAESDNAWVRQGKGQLLSTLSSADMKPNPLPPSTTFSPERAESHSLLSRQKKFTSQF